MKERVKLPVAEQNRLHFQRKLAPCKVILESLGFRIPRCGFRIRCLWIHDSTSMDSGFHNQQPGSWITIMVGFRIPLAGFRISKPWIPDSTYQNYLDSALPYMGRENTICMGRNARGISLLTFIELDFG